MSRRLICSCDESCLYIGDCCFDFVYLCKRGHDLDAALTHQEQIMNDFRKKTICSAQYLPEDVLLTGDLLNYKISTMPMIAKCPSNATKSLSALCEHYEQHAFPALPQIPVIHQGIIYRNTYCSLCSEWRVSGRSASIGAKLQNHNYQRQPPWLYTRSFVISTERGRVWKLFCVDEGEDNSHCSYLNTSDFNSCPKVEVQLTSISEYGFRTKSGHLIPYPSKYILTSNQTALICANQCKADIFPDTQTLDIFVPICYSVSMSCLMMTFIIYLVAPPLRNVPGLMLMNLIVALFLAQMSYVISSYGIFITHPHWCQLLGATQHYLRLTAFAWMACITVDVYRCLSMIQVAHTDAHKNDTISWLHYVD